MNKFLKIPINFGTSIPFFNVVCTEAPELMDDLVENLVRIVFNRLKTNEALVIYGTDNPTPA